MDRALKERITGAVVLVVIAILVVPVFLDGPSTDAEIVTETVSLPGQSEQSRKQQTIVLERDRDQPVPATLRDSDTPAPAVAEAPDAAETAPEPAEETPRPAPEPVVEEQGAEVPDEPATAPAETATAPAEKETPAPVETGTPASTEVAQAAPDTGSDASTESATGMWAVQLGSFSKSDNAERLAGDLRANGYAAFLSRLNTGDGELHRVRVGPQKDRESAEAVAKRLGGDGHEGQVVPHP